jgi:hypothetical protein
MMAALAMAGALMIGLAACGSDKPNYRSKVDAAVYGAQARGYARMDLEPDLRADLTTDFVNTCRGDNNSIIATRMSVRMGGKLASMAIYVVGQACPDRLDDIGAVS